MKLKKTRKFNGIELDLISALNVDLAELKQRAKSLQKSGLINRFRIVPQVSPDRIKQDGFGFIYKLYAEQKKNYSILVEDTGRTFNINMHTFDCSAFSRENAIEKMKKNRPEFTNRKIFKIEVDGVIVYEDPEFRASVNFALAQINAKNK